LIFNCEDIIHTSLKDGIDVDDLLNDSSKKILDISQRRIKKDFLNIHDAVKNALDIMSQSYGEDQESSVLKTSYIELDNLIYGLNPSDLIILAARPSMGKTAFALNLAVRVAKLDKKPGVAVFSMEMSTFQLVQRMLAQEATIDSSKLKTGKLLPDEWTKFALHANELGNLNIFVDDTAGITLIELKSKARRLKNEGKLDLILIDYLQLITSSIKENRQQQISDISRNLKMLAKDLNVPIIALSQLSRSVEQRPNKRPMLSDLRESGSIEQDADIVMFLHREDYYQKDNEAVNKSKNSICEVLVEKNRNGATGSCELLFIKDYTRFENLAKH
jgi:replicative DNA helicase